MALVCGTFPPSSNLLQYVSVYLQQAQIPYPPPISKKKDAGDAPKLGPDGKRESGISNEPLSPAPPTPSPPSGDDSPLTSTPPPRQPSPSPSSPGFLAVPGSVKEGRSSSVGSEPSTPPIRKSSSRDEDTGEIGDVFDDADLMGGGGIRQSMSKDKDNKQARRSPPSHARAASTALAVPSLGAIANMIVQPKKEVVDVSLGPAHFVALSRKLLARFVFSLIVHNIYCPHCCLMTD
jgi:hypothetical protein